MLNFAGGVTVRDKHSAIKMPGLTITPLVSSDDSDGELTILEGRFEPGASTPAHITHREAKMIYIVEGTFEFMVGGDVREFGPGGFVKIPNGVVHRFQNTGSKPGIIVGTSTPGGHEKFLQEMSDLMQDEEVDPLRLQQICETYAVELVD